MRAMNGIDKERFAKRLNELVGNRSRSQVAREIGIGDSSMRGYLKGSSNPSAAHLAAIVRYFNISITEFMAVKEDKLEAAKQSLETLSESERKRLIAWLSQGT